MHDAGDVMGALGGGATGRRGQRVQLRLRVTCSAPNPDAEAAWTAFLIRILRKQAANE